MEAKHHEQSNTNRKSVLNSDTVVDIDDEGGHSGKELVTESDDTITTEQEPFNSEELQYDR